MKSGAVLEENLLSAPVIDCDDHDRALSAAPQPRHHLQSLFKKHVKYQIDNKTNGMVHNHPSGDPTPSQADIEMTLQVQEAAQVLGLTLHDHLIIGKSREVSFRSAGYL